MEAKALICHEDRRFELATVTLPDPGPDRILVRTLKTGVSIGTEFALIRNKISWGPYPLCTGYQGIGVVEEVGPNVCGFAPGDRVYYRDNKWITLADGRSVSPVSGTHASHAVIDPKTTHGIAHLPDGVNEDAASLFVMPAVGLYGVDMANVRMGSTVVVFGCGLIGLAVVAMCALRGAVVIAVDIRGDRLELARKFGAEHLVNGADGDPLDAVRQVSPGGGDFVFEATGIPACIDRAIRLAKPFAHFVLQGNYGADPVSFRFLTPHGKRLTWHFPCDDGMAPCRRAVIKLMAAGALPWERTVTTRVPAARAADLYARIEAGKADDVVGAVIDWN